MHIKHSLDRHFETKKKRNMPIPCVHIYFESGIFHTDFSIAIFSNPFFVCTQNFAHLLDTYFRTFSAQSKLSIRIYCFYSLLCAVCTRYCCHLRRRGRCRHRRRCCCERQNDNKRSKITKRCECQGSCRIQQFSAVS